MKNKFMKKIKKTVMVLILSSFVLGSSGSFLEAALPEKGTVNNLYGLKWEKPHFKKNKIYITLKNETAVFQALSVTAFFVDADDQILAEAPFEVGLAPGKSIRAFSPIEKIKGDLEKSVKIVWRSE